jgi:copper(I)-binding protein
VSRRPVTVTAKAVAVLLSAAALSACGTGLNAVTYKETGRVDGAVADVGGRTGIAVRHLHVAPPAEGSVHEPGSTALVLGGLSNGGSTDDALVGVTVTGATGAALTLDGVAVDAVPVPAGKTADSGWAIRLDGLTNGLHVAQSVEVVLTFAKAGRVTLSVPVLAGDNGLEERHPEQDPYGGHE